MHLNKGEQTLRYTKHTKRQPWANRERISIVGRLVVHALQMSFVVPESGDTASNSRRPLSVYWRVWVFALLCAMGVMGPVHAELHKCVESSGRTVYQDQPCGPSAKAVDHAIRTTSPLPMLPGNVSAKDAKKVIVQGCMSAARQSTNGVFREVFEETPQKISAFCECTANEALKQHKRLAKLMETGDQAGYRALGLEAGLTCSAQLR